VAVEPTSLALVHESLCLDLSPGFALGAALG
jgi:hypothetical protein